MKNEWRAVVSSSQGGLPGYSLQVKELAHLLLQRLGNRKPNKKSISLTMFIYTQKTCH